MLNSKQNSDKNTLNLQDRVPIVKKVLVGETLKNIKPGKTAHFSRRELGNRDNTVQSAVHRLKLKAKAQEYSLRIDDSDGSFWVTRSNLKTAEA